MFIFSAATTVQGSRTSLKKYPGADRLSPGRNQHLPASCFFGIFAGLRGQCRHERSEELPEAEVQAELPYRFMRPGEVSAQDAPVHAGENDPEACADADKRALESIAVEASGIPRLAEVGEYISLKRPELSLDERWTDLEVRQPHMIAPELVLPAERVELVTDPGVEELKHRLRPGLHMDNVDADDGRGVRGSGDGEPR